MAQVRVTTHLPFSQVLKFSWLGDDSTTVFVLPENSSFGGGPSMISHASLVYRSSAGWQQIRNGF